MWVSENNAVILTGFGSKCCDTRGCFVDYHHFFGLIILWTVQTYVQFYILNPCIFWTQHIQISFMSAHCANWAKLWSALKYFIL